MIPLFYYCFAETVTRYIIFYLVRMCCLLYMINQKLMMYVKEFGFESVLADDQEYFKILLIVGCNILQSIDILR